jgi:hypothetical protein
MRNLAEVTMGLRPNLLTKGLGFFIFLASFMFFCSIANATVARVQSVSQNCTTFSTPAICTVNIAAVQSGDLIVVTSLIRNDTTQVAPTVTDSQSNSYTQIWHYTDGYHYSYTMNYLANVTNTPTSVTVDLTTGGLSVTMIVVEYSGVVTSSPKDVSTITTTSSGTSYSSASVTTTSAYEILVGGVFNNTGYGVTFTGTPNEWTNFSTQNDMPSGNTIGMQDQGVSTSGSFANTGTATLNNNPVGANFVGMAAFKTTQAPPSSLTPVTYYIRAGASGNNSGSDWTNAFPDFPGATSTTAPNMVRGAKYYVASGNYGSYLFNTPESDTSVITIKKATIVDHGTSVGWDPSYGTGQAVFGNTPFNNEGPPNYGYWYFFGVNFSTGYWIFDGAVNSGLDPTGYGFTFLTQTTTNGESYLNINQAETAQFNGMTIRNTSITCYGPNDTGGSVGINPGTASDVESPVIQYVYVNNCNEAVNIFGNYWLIEHSYFLNDWSSSSHHGVMIDVQNTYNMPIGNSSTFRYNFVQGCPYSCIESNGWAGQGVASPTMNGWNIYGNIFVPGTGGTDGIISASDMGTVSNTNIFNNTIISTTMPFLSEQDPGGPGTSGNVVENNLFYNAQGYFSLFTTNGGSPIVHEYNSYWSSNWNWQSSDTVTSDQTVASGNPFVNLASGDYHPILHTAPGLTLSAPYNVDPAGTTRGVGGNWDIGAYQVGNVYYIDFNSGSDSYNGTSESSPWKYAPGMQPFSGTYTHHAGDHFIFKGGVTWPSTAFPMNIANGGSLGNSDYYGVDKTWFNGNSWAQPVFDGQYNVNQIIYLGSNNSYITVDNLELRNITNPPNTTSFAYGLIGGFEPQNILMENLYLHGWRTIMATSSTTSLTVGTGTQSLTVGTGYEINAGYAITIVATSSPSVTMSGTITSYNSITGALVLNITSVTGSGTYSLWTVPTNDDAHGAVIFVYSSNLTTWSNVVLQNSTITNIDNTGNSTQNGVALRQVQTIQNCTIHDVSSAVLFTSNFNNNTLYNVSYPATNYGFDSTYHTNGIYIDGAGSSTSYVYNNYIHDIYGGANEIYPNPHGGQTDYVYNNVIYGVQSAQVPIEIDTYNYWCSNCGPDGGPNFTEPQADTAGNVYIYNNTIVAYNNNDPAIHVAVTGPGTNRPPLNILVAENNQVIGTEGILTDGTQGNNVNYLTTSNNIIQDTATASSQGYTLSDLYAPTSGSQTVGQGTNLLSLAASPGLSALTSDIASVSRPQNSPPNWDAGAYQHTFTTIPPTVSLTTDQPSYTPPATIVLSATASATTGAKITSVAFYNGSSLLGSSTTSPYSYTWTNVAAGTYSLTAIAYDSSGNSTTSFAVSVTVNGPLYGDVNGAANGQVTLLDSELTAQDAIGLSVASFIPANAEVDGTGTVDIYDAYLIAEYAAELITQFPAQQ